MTLTEKIRNLRDTLLHGLVERDDAVRLALLAAFSGEHLLLIGPPGTAKSMVAKRLHHILQEGSYFEHLLTRFTVPDELFGPLSIKALEQDKYHRQIEHYLPTASIAFLDEIFKANSAILNALLTLLNEREFDNGSERVPTPLVSVVGASNELPEGVELDALYDRFLLRLYVGPVSPDGFVSLLELPEEGGFSMKPEHRFTTDELEQIRREAQSLPLDEDARALLIRLRTFVMEQNVDVSDRRWRKIIKLLRVSAYTNGHDKVTIWDCWLLQHMAWNRPDERKLIHDWYQGQIGCSKDWEPANLTRLTVVWEKQLERNQDGREQALNEEGELLYEDPMGEGTTTNPEGDVPQMRGKQSLYLAPTNAHTDSYYNEPVKSRTNNNKGYTRKELSAFFIEGTRSHRRPSFQDWSGSSDYLNDERNRFTKVDTLRPAMQPLSFDPSLIKEWTQAVQRLMVEMEQWGQRVDERIEELGVVLKEHLWVDDSFAQPATDSLKEVKDKVLSLYARMQKVLEGYNNLPVRNLNIEV